MNQDDETPKKATSGNTEDESEPRKSRKHGYRGYPNKPDIGGNIHTGTGFAGVGPTGGAGTSGSSLISDKTRESVEELGKIRRTRSSSLSSVPR